MSVDNSILINDVAYCIIRKFADKKTIEEAVEDLLKTEINNKRYFTDKAICGIIDYE